MATEITAIAIWIAAGFGLGVLFMEVRMSLFARIAALEAAAAAITAGLAAKAETAAENIGHAIETVSMDAFSELKSVVDGLVDDVAALKAAIGTEGDAPAPAPTETPVAEVTPSSDPAPAPAQAEPLAPAATESTGS